MCVWEVPKNSPLKKKVDGTRGKSICDFGAMVTSVDRVVPGVVQMDSSAVDWSRVV